MNKKAFDSALNHVVNVKLQALDKLIKDMIKPLGDIGNPEKVLGKPYEQWTPEDFQTATSIYGTAEPSVLSEFIFKQELKKVEELEAEVKDNAR